MNSNDLQIWKNSWINVGQISLWGYGQMGKIYLNALRNQYDIKCIIDNDLSKNGLNDKGIPVVHPDLTYIRNQKIVITTYYDQIKEQLTKQGLKEYVDFCDVRTFISCISWFERKEIVLSKLHISITTACTLNCKYCNMYTPFHKKAPIMYSFEQIKEQLDSLFGVVNKVIRLVLLGGEPLLNRDLYKVIDYLQSKYSKQFDMLEIVTNGTIIPDKSLIKALQHPNILVSMSDYNLSQSYKDEFLKVKDSLTGNDINIMVNANLEWKDFSFPYSNLNLSDEQAYINMNKCNPPFRGFNDFKFYFCHIVWSADKAGIYKEKPTDYINFSTLTTEEKEKIVLMNICCFDNCYNSLCNACGGCSDLNNKFISTGEQAL